jgi:transposase InsO family protein
VRKAERQHKTGILRFRTDNGGEYVNKEIETFFSESGISHDRTVPYSHESNGVAERCNRTITTIARTLLVDYESKALWAEAIAYAVYTKNRLPHNALLLQSTPYQALHGQKPSITPSAIWKNLLHAYSTGNPTCWIQTPTTRT